MAWTEAKESKKEDIEARLRTIGGEMLKIEYLENCLKQTLDLSVRKFVHLTLAELYDKRLMLTEAAKNMQGAAEIAVTFREKMDYYMKEVGLLIRHGSFDKADEAFSKALACGNSREKEELKAQIKNFYMKRAAEFELEKKNNSSIKVYEKLLRVAYVPEEEKKQINKKLAILYGRVGKIQEAMRFEKL